MQPPQMAALLASLPDGLGWLDQERRLSWLNPPLAEFLGQPAERLQGASLSSVLGEEDVRALLRLVEEGFRGHAAEGQVALLEGPRGPRMRTVCVSPHLDEGGAVQAVLLRTTPGFTNAGAGHEEVETLARIGTYYTDLKRGCWWGSDGFCQLFGFEPGGVYSQQDFAALVHPDDCEQVMAFFAECLAEGRPFDYEYRCLRRGTGEVLHVRSTSKVYLDAQGQPDHILGIKQDVTQVKALQKHLASASRMTTVGKLAGNIAHDFNNTLSAMLTLTELARMDLEGGDTPAPLLSEIEQVVRRSQGVVRKLLEFSRRGPVRAQRTDLNRLVEGMRPLLTQLLGGEVSLAIHGSPAPLFAKVDAAAIEQLLVNLAANARQAMAGRGCFTLSVHGQRVQAPRRLSTGDVLECGEYVCVTASDDGPGIAPEVLEHVFEPFYTTQPEGDAMGLGLATSYGTARRAGGHLEVRSSPAGGATFTLHLPRIESVGAAASTEDARQLPRRRILLVDDTVALLRPLSRMLSKLGYAVETESQPHKALQRLERDDFDLLLTDVVMPGMSGLELADRARGLRPSLPVLFMSGHLGEAADQLGDEAMARLVTKPFSMAELTHHLGQIFETS